MNFQDLTRKKRTARSRKRILAFTTITSLAVLGKRYQSSTGKRVNRKTTFRCWKTAVFPNEWCGYWLQ